jgi:hypothetical protein
MGRIACVPPLLFKEASLALGSLTTGLEAHVPGYADQEDAGHRHQEAQRQA